MSLNVLFEQILHSEQRAQERRNLLNEVKTEIAKCQQKILETRDEQNSLQGKLVVKLQQLAEEELQLKWLETREAILIEQKQKLLKEKEGHEKQLEEVRKEVVKEREKFLSELKEFGLAYDLGGDGHVKRQESAKKEQQKLKIDEQQLENELSSYTEHKRELEEAEREKKRAEEEVASLRQKHSRLAQVLKEHHKRTADLELNKEELSQAPDMDPEFLRLKDELQVCKDDSMEAVCSALRQELRKLQQLKIKKEQEKREQEKAMLAEAVIIDSTGDNNTQDLSSSWDNDGHPDHDWAMDTGMGKSESVRKRPAAARNVPTRRPQMATGQKPNLGKLTRSIKEMKATEQIRVSPRTQPRRSTPSQSASILKGQNSEEAERQGPVTRKPGLLRLPAAAKRVRFR
ncbi:coiled-coil domain-containing protein 172-like isoform X1 [Branchiostoma floridae]|uniref:Coiled-coil domain-containing protein 172 n=1 Tax=Branchiostoma floridae TaxID=7739 RepID=A0A9J7L468_BRAFL|nr:coiled-coil domain-containing protein 172-like isoform X1 [Branchiostoma floridae]